MNNTNDVLASISILKDVQLDSRLDVLGAMIDLDNKKNCFLEHYSGDDVSEVFQEGLFNKKKDKNKTSESDKTDEKPTKEVEKKTINADLKLAEETVKFEIDFFTKYKKELSDADDKLKYLYDNFKRFTATSPIRSACRIPGGKYSFSEDELTKYKSTLADDTKKLAKVCGEFVKLVDNVDCRKLDDSQLKHLYGRAGDHTNFKLDCSLHRCDDALSKMKEIYENAFGKDEAKKLHDEAYDIFKKNSK